MILVDIFTLLNPYQMVVRYFEDTNFHIFPYFVKFQGRYNVFLDLTLNTMQLETPHGNDCCHMANVVHNSRLVHSFIIALYMNMINRKQFYTNQNSSRLKKVNRMRHFTVIADLNVAQKKI